MITTTTTLIGFSAGKTTLPERLPLVAAVDRRRLAQRRVDRLQPGQVQHHDVADVPPRHGDQQGGEVPRQPERVVEPREVRTRTAWCRRRRSRPARRARSMFSRPRSRREHRRLPDEADDGEREHDREVVDALVDPGAADVLVEQVGEEHADRRADREPEDEHEVVEQRREQVAVEDREDLPVVLEADRADVGERREVVPLRERQPDGEHRRDPHQHDVQEGRDADHHAQPDPVAAGQRREAATTAPACGAPPRSSSASTWDSVTAAGRAFTRRCTSPSGPRRRRGSSRCCAGSAMKSARAAPTTLAAKSGSVSRSRNWAMYFAAPTSLGRLLLQRVVAASVGAVVGGDDRRVRRRCRRRSRRHRRGRSSSALAPSSLPARRPS